MPTTTQTLCYNCFAQRESPEGPCPHCGFDLAENRQKFPVALPAGTVLNGRYIVGRVLGQGGFGITYVAFDTQLQAKVAVKEYMPNDISTRIGATVSVAMETRAEDFTYGAERFQEEARTLAKFIGHPNIAGVSSYFDENGTSYFVMDYIEGVSFKNYIANNGGKVSVDEALNVMIPVLRALTAVHAEGFIHRDVTPDNIYISKDGNVKLLDFGSARYSIGDKSKSLDVILKVGYAPKEQYIRRGRQGPFTDVYSCAACFYAALTGFLPPESLERLDHDELVPVSRSVPDIPEWLDRAILKGLAVQPEDRFQSAAEFLDAIENQLMVEVPGGAAEPAQPEKKKPKTALIAGIAAALAVVLGVGVFAGGRGGGESAAPTPNHGTAAAEDGPKGAPAQADDDLPPLKEAEVPSITIQGQEYSTDLRALDLSGTNGLTDEDIAPLKYMVNLMEVKISDQNQIADLAPFSNLTELRELDLTGGAARTSELVGRGVRDLTPLANLTNLTKLALVVSGPEDLSPLGGLTELTDLTLIGFFDTGDFSFLRNLTNLKSLFLYNPNYNVPFPMDDLSVLSGLTQLETLRVNVSGIADFDWASPLTELVTLELNGNTTSSLGNYVDVDGLANLTKLQSLTLPQRDFKQDSDRNYYNIDGLSKLTNLTYLCMPQMVVDLTPLQNLTKLQTLIISGGYCSGGFTSLAPLANLTELISLDLATPGVQAFDLSPLENLTKLRSLRLYGYWEDGQSFTSLEPLASLQDLQSLQLWMYNATDISPLRELKNLQSVRINNYGLQKITDLSPVDHVPSKSIEQ